MLSRQASLNRAVAFLSCSSKSWRVNFTELRHPTLNIANVLMSISWSIRLTIISCYLSCSASEDIYLRCDAWETTTLAATYDSSDYCIVTDFHVAETQNVVIDDGGMHWTRNQMVSHLKFYDSSLIYIHPAILEKFINLKNLDVSNSEIHDISRNTFSSANRLSWLNVSWNDILKINGAVFQGASSLRELDLSHNRIQSLHALSFHGLTNLTFLDVSANSIVNLPDNIFSYNEMMEKVILSYNRIDAISTAVFKNLKWLSYVNLAANNLAQLDPDVFKGALSMRHIILSNNVLRQLHLNLASTVTTLFADENELFSLQIYNSRSERGYQTNVTYTSLQKLDLSRNKLTDLRNVTDLPYLLELKLSHNNIGPLNISTFQKQKRLKKLVLRNCSLSGLTFGTFRGQTNLEYLDLSENRLNHLNLDIFLPYMYRTLEELYISSNNLSQITGHHTFSAFDNLKKIGLDGNNFNCSYLLHLITAPSFVQPLELTTNGDEPKGQNIHGVACTHQEVPAKNAHLSNTTPYTPKSNQEKLYESTIDRLEQHLLLMRIFVIIIVVLCFCAIIFKMVVFFKRNSGSWGYPISYRPTTNSFRPGEGLS